MSDLILAINAGSSSLKLGIYQVASDGPPELLAKGLLEDVGAEPRFMAKDGAGAVLDDRHWPKDTAHDEMLGAVLHWMEQRGGMGRLVGAGHRIVHGGREFNAPVLLDEATIEAIDRLTPLAPLHQLRSLQPVRALCALRPDLRQVGCFDTAFHHALAAPVSRYAIPRRFEDAGVRKYGFHGLSYEYVSGALAALDPGYAAKRTIVAHLGQGASLCAIRQCRSVDTTMGFSVLDGLVMGTRCGAIDPGIILYLIKVEGLSADEIEHTLYHESGLLGVSGISADMRALTSSSDPRATEAVELFAFRVARETAALANTLGGLDLLVFTGGIGEHAPKVRAAIGERLGWLGVDIAPDANRAAEARIDAGGAVDVRIVPTDEESVICRQTLACLRAGDTSSNHDKASDT